MSRMIHSPVVNNFDDEGELQNSERNELESIEINRKLYDTLILLEILV